MSGSTSASAAAQLCKASPKISMGVLLGVNVAVAVLKLAAESADIFVKE